MAPLVPKYEKVAQALARGESHRIAYQEGGFKHNRSTAYRLCTKPEIVARVEEIRKENAEQLARARQEATRRTGIDLAWIEEKQAYVVQLAMRGQPVRDATGKKKRDPETGDIIYKPDLQAANQGLITLGRMKGAFIDRTEIGGPGEFARLQDSELDKQIAELARKIGLPEEAVLLLEDMSNRGEAAE